MNSEDKNNQKNSEIWSEKNWDKTEGGFVRVRHEGRTIGKNIKTQFGEVKLKIEMELKLYILN